MTYLRGMDTSYSVPSMSPYGFAFLKVSEGNNGQTPVFTENVKTVSAAKIPYGAYHFGWFTEDVRTNFDNFVRLAGSSITDRTILALDAEPYPDQRNVGSKTLSEIKIWCEEFQKLCKEFYPKNCFVLYTPLVWGKAFSQLGLVCDYWMPNWIYTAPTDQTEYEHIDGFTVKFWQYTNTPFDRDVFLGNSNDLNTWLGESKSNGGNPPPISSPTNGGDMTEEEMFKAVWRIPQFPLGNDMVTAEHYMRHINYQLGELLQHNTPVNAPVSTPIDSPPVTKPAPTENPPENTPVNETNPQ
ncbi:MAG: GH25 family lysozyme [Candidatus Saccharimonadales bacterium]